MNREEIAKKIIEVADDAYKMSDDSWCIKYGENTGGYESIITQIILSEITDAEKRVRENPRTYRIGETPPYQYVLSENEMDIIIKSTENRAYARLEDIVKIKHSVMLLTDNTGTKMKETILNDLDLVIAANSSPSISKCPTCGKEMAVVGNTTMHYECLECVTQRERGRV